MASRDDGVVSAKTGGAKSNPSAVASPQPATRKQGNRLHCVMRLIFTSRRVSHLTGCDRSARAGRKNV
jgi:hypothetical protein